VEYKLVISPSAERDIAKIEEYISKDKPSAAKKMVKKIAKALRNLKLFPNANPLLSNKFDVDLEFRMLVTKPYISFYLVKDNVVEVVRILHGKSDYFSELGI